MAEYTLGTARGEIIIGADTKGADQAKRSLDDVGDAGARASKGVDKAGTIMGAAGLAIAGGFAVAIKSAADFQQRMSAVQAVSGASAAEMDTLTAKALQLGKDTSFSASEAATAIEELVKAGVSVPDVMNGAADATVALAAAGEVSLPEAATQAANAMNAFGLSAQQMPKVADLIAGAANASAIDVSEFGMSLKQVGAVAHLAGVSFSDTATAIALLGNAGIKGSDAGTSLKTMFQRLIPQTDKQKAAMEDLGLITKDGANQFFDASGKAKSLSDISQILQNSLKGMTKEQKLATLGVLFGADAIRGAAILADQGAAGFDKMAASMTKVKAADVAKTRMDNLKGSIEQMKGSLETAGIAIGTVLLPAIRKVVDGVTALLNKFLALTPEQQKLALTVIAAAGGFLLFAAAALKVGAAIKSFTTWAKAAGTTMKALQLIFAANPFGLVVIGLGLLVAALILAYNRFAPFRNLVNSVAAVLKGALLTALNAVKTAIGVFVAAWHGIDQQPAGALGAVAKAGQAARAVFEFLANLFMTKVLPALKELGGTVMGQVKAGLAAMMGAVQGLMPTLQQFWAAIQTAGSAIGAVLVPILKTVVTFIAGTFLPIFLKVVGFFTGVFINAVVGAFKGVVQVIKGALQIITGIINVFKGVFTGDWSAVWTGIKQIASGIWNIISGAFKVWLNVGILKVFGVGLKAIAAIWRGAWTGIRAVGMAILRGIASFVKGTISNVRSTISGGMNAARAIFTAVMNAIRAVVMAVFRFIVAIIKGDIATIKSIISSGFNAARSVVSSVSNAIRSTVSSAFNAIRSSISRVISGIRSSVTSGFNSVMNTVRGFRSRVIGFFSGAGSWLVGAGRRIIAGLAAGVQAAGQRVIDAARRVVDKVKRLLPGSPVKDGPLRSLNRGHAGREIVRMIASGIERETPRLERVALAMSANVARPVAAAPSKHLLGGRQTVAPAGDSYHIDNVSIPASDLAEMRGVADFFNRVQQEARRMNPRLRKVVA